MRILYLEDDEQLAAIVKEYLGSKLIIDTANDVSIAKEYLEQFHYDVALLDRNIHGHDIGMELIDVIKKKNDSIGIIVLSAYSIIDDKIAGLELGADDYMEKPYDTKELLARIHALHRRNVPKIINIESMSFDTSKRRYF